MFGVKNIFSGSTLNRSANSQTHIDESDRLITSTPVCDDSANLEAMNNKNLCALCSETFKAISSKDSTLQCVCCYYCSSWICISCFDPRCTTVQQRSSLLQFLSSDKVEVHCGKCTKPNLGDLIYELNEAKKQIETLTTTVQDLQERVTTVSTPLGGVGAEGVDIARLIAESVARVVPVAMAEFWATFQSREKAKCGLVISGLTAVDGKSDMELVKDTLLPELQVNQGDVTVKSVFRMGKGKKVGTKMLPPLVKVVFDNNDDRNLVLKGASNLKDSTLLDGVYLRPSLTGLQQEINQRLLHQRYLHKGKGRRLQVRYSNEGDPFLWDTVTKVRMEETHLNASEATRDVGGAEGGGSPRLSPFH